MRLMPHFADAKVGMVQARWGHINQDYSLLTKIQSILLDGHFVLEHGGRNRASRFFNFNGTAGIWRRVAIDDAGGWQHDTLTEDLDLSYRAQLRGWRFVFVPDVIAPAEVPVEMNAFKSQQHRWAKGSIQTCRKLLPSILRAKLPLGVKVEAFFHLTANFNYPLMCVLSVLMFPSIKIRYNMGWYEMLLIDVPLFFAATFSVCNFYMVCQREIHRDWLARIKYLPLLMSIGIGLSINNSRAVFEALFNRQSEFTRTPKYRIEGETDEWVGKRYRQSVDGAAADRAGARALFHGHRLLRPGQRDLRHGAVPGPLPDRIPLYRPALPGPAVRRRPGRAQDPGGQWEISGDHDITSCGASRLARDGALGHRPAARSCRRLEGPRSGQDHHPQGQHLLALPVSRPPTPRRGSSKGRSRRSPRRGFTDQVCVQNKTVVTNAFKGEDLNHYVPIFKRYDIPVLYNFKDEDMTWVRYQPKARMRVLDRIFPEGIHIPDYFFGKNIVHLPTVKCHIYTTTTGAMKNAFGGLLNTRRHYTHSWIHETLVDLLAIQKEIHSGLFAIMDGTTAGNGPGPRTMYPVVKNVMLASERSGRDRRGRRRR